MQNEIENETEIVIDFGKIIKIIKYRKILIAKVIIFCILFAVILTYILPKQYATEANIYINKSSNTNLIELNPYLIASMGADDKLSGILAGTSNMLQNEMEIMKSPLVMDKVILENNLRYPWGKKKGELLSTKDFLRKNISIENEKGTNVITIEYKSKKPQLSYNVVNSIIANYQQANEEINTQKAAKDKKLLETSYAQTNKVVNKKLSALKHTNALPDTAMTGMGILAALRGHNRAISSAVGSVQSQIVEGQKSQISIEQDVDKLKMVKSKLEWSNLVEKMAKDTSNVIILKKPEIKRSFEQVSPKLWINLILGIIFGFLASIIAVVLSELKDKKLTYSTLGDKVNYEPEDYVDDLKFFLLKNLKEQVLFIVFEGFQAELLQKIEGINNFKIINAGISQKIIDEISYSNKIILFAKVGQTSKKLYKQIKDMCVETQKQICIEVV